MSRSSFSASAGFLLSFATVIFGLPVAALGEVVLNGEGLLDPLNTDAAWVESDPDVAGDNSHFIAVWSSNRDTGGFGNDFDILHAQSFDGGATWSEAQPLLPAMANDLVDDLRPSIATDGQGNWMVSWSQGEGAAPVTVSNDNGATWPSPKTWTTIPGYIGDTSLSYTDGAFVAAATVSKPTLKGNDYRYWIQLGVTRNLGFCWGVTTSYLSTSPQPNPPVVVHTGPEGQVYALAGMGDIVVGDDISAMFSNNLGKSWYWTSPSPSGKRWTYPQTGRVALHQPSGEWRMLQIVQTKTAANVFQNSEFGFGSHLYNVTEFSSQPLEIIIAKAFTQPSGISLPPRGRQPTVARDSSGLSVFTFTPWGFRYSTDDGATWTGPESYSGGANNETLATDNAGNWVSLYTRGVTGLGTRIAWRRLESTDKQRYKGASDGETEGVAEGELEGMTDGEETEEGEEEPINVFATAITVLTAWQSTDSDGDLRISPAEFTAAYGANLDAFSLLDSSRDNLLSIPELQRHIPFDKPIHDADTNADRRIQLNELLRVIQLYNGAGYRCAAAVDDSEDGYEPGPFLTIECNKHAADRVCDGDGIIELSELLRVIQLFRFESLEPCESEDGFCAGTE